MRFSASSPGTMSAISVARLLASVRRCSTRPFGSGSDVMCIAACVLFCHPLAQREWPHIGPRFFYVVETGFLVALNARVRPAARNSLPFRPERILFLMIDEHFEHTVLTIKAACRHGLSFL